MDLSADGTDHRAFVPWAVGVEPVPGEQGDVSGLEVDVEPLAEWVEFQAMRVFGEPLALDP